MTVVVVIALRRSEEEKLCYVHITYKHGYVLAHSADTADPVCERRLLAADEGFPAGVAAVAAVVEIQLCRSQ